MAFADNKNALMQEHFTVVEIDLPAFSSVQTCTLPVTGGTGFYTPLTCDETWDTTTFKTYRFSTTNLPRTYGRPPTSSGLPGDIIELDGAAVYPIITSVDEEVTELRPGEGLAIQGSASVTFTDTSADPGPVQETLTGTFFGKLAARNILNNKTARIIQYHVKSDGIYAESDGLTRFYIVDMIKNNGRSTWTIKFKDELSKLDKDKNQFPAPTNGSLRSNVSETTTSIAVDTITDWNQTSRPYTIKIGDELMKVVTVVGNQGAAPILVVSARGADIFFTSFLSTTIAAEHSVGDAVQICHTSDNEDIDLFLAEVLESSGVSASRIPSADWAAEIDEWHPADKINTIWHEPVEANDVIKQITTGFLLDIWYDNEVQEVKLSAISVWQESGPTIEEGKQITFETFRIAPKELIRFSRAFIYFDKPNKVDNDDIKNYRSLSVNINNTLEDAGLFGEPKTKEFNNSHVIGSNAADLLVQRTVARFGDTPEEYTFETEEKFLNYVTGDIVDVITPEKQDFAGLPKNIRGQILSVKPVYTDFGRMYRTKMLTFESAFADGAEFTISADTQNLNIHTFVGAPSQIVNVTIVINGATIGSLFTGLANPAIVAGNFAFGSKITLILKNNAILQGRGGDGGFGGNSFMLPALPPPTNIVGSAGLVGGFVYYANGINTDIHLGGTILGHTALGTLRAPGGGGGGENGQGAGVTPVGGDGGGGGAGSIVGNGGSAGVVLLDISGFPGAPGPDGIEGSSGTTGGLGGAPGGAGAGTGGDWGVAGTAGDQAGGAAGKGITKGGAVINILTSGNTGRFTNGGGDTPDVLS